MIVWSNLGRHVLVPSPLVFPFLSWMRAHSWAFRHPKSNTRLPHTELSLPYFRSSKWGTSYPPDFEHSCAPSLPWWLGWSCSCKAEGATVSLPDLSIIKWNQPGSSYWPAISLVEYRRSKLLGLLQTPIWPRELTHFGRVLPTWDCLPLQMLHRDKYW